MLNHRKHISVLEHDNHIRTYQTYTTLKDSKQRKYVCNGNYWLKMHNKNYNMRDYWNMKDKSANCNK